MKLVEKNERKFRLNVMGSYVKKYRKIYLFVVGIISIIETLMMIRAAFLFDFDKPHHLAYFCSYIYLFVVSLTCFFILYLKKKESEKELGVLALGYSFSIMAWATLLSSLDLYSNNIPIVFLTILGMVGGILVIDPVFFSINALLGVGALEIVNIVVYNGNSMRDGDHINVFVFVIMSFIVCYRHYIDSVNNYKHEEHLLKLSYTCQLTGLGNETSYIKETEELNSLIREGNAEFAIIVLDVNGIKTTNDTYGHRYGCHLIVETGKRLPNFFKTSKLYHIGGDEFVVVVQGDDYFNLDVILNEIKSNLVYEEIIFEKELLYLSVAVGFAYYEKGMMYRDVFQKADKSMYKNKREIKVKYEIPNR